MLLLSGMAIDKMIASRHIIFIAFEYKCISHLSSDVTELSSGVCLGDPGASDAVTCSAVWDVDGDGRNEVLIGTYGMVREL